MCGVAVLHGLCVVVMFAMVLVDSAAITLLFSAVSPAAVHVAAWSALRIFTLSALFTLQFVQVCWFLYVTDRRSVVSLWSWLRVTLSCLARLLAPLALRSVARAHWPARSADPGRLLHDVQRAH